MRYNLGCGLDYRYGWVNIDRFAAVKPDRVMDLESFPWPIADDSAEAVLLSHVLEHLGGGSDRFLGVMRELYRICKPDATVTIIVPDPRHDDFFGDPTHQRAILPGLFQTLDLASNEDWIARGLPGTPLAKYLGIDFATRSVAAYFDPYWHERSEAERAWARRSANNAVQVWEIVLVARKPFAPGRSLAHYDAVVLERWSGIGDALMAFAAARAIKAATGKAIVLKTAPALAELARRALGVDAAASDEAGVAAALARLGATHPRRVDLPPAAHGVSRFHQVDSYLLALGLTLPDAEKRLGLDLPEDEWPLPALPEGRPRVVIHVGTTDPNRTWPDAFWGDLTTALRRAGASVIAIGHRGAAGRGAAAPPGVLDLVDRLDLAGTVRLLRQCDLLISNDAGPIQLAGATDIAIIGLYSVVAGANRLPYRHGSTSYKTAAVAPQCPFHPCLPAINDAAAVARFCATTGIAAADTPALLANWCLNPDRFACTRERGMLDKVLTAMRELL
jgi:ADP-heptose:LPS heptosyltransferase